MDARYSFDWADLAFASKKSLNELGAIFIVAPREMSVARFTQLVKMYLPKGNIILGLSKEPYVWGLEDQPQFRMLGSELVQSVIDKVNAKSPHKIYVLHYFQRELPHLFEKLKFREVLLVNGSWHKSFHTLPAYYALIKNGAPYQMISPFVDDAEARRYALEVQAELEMLHPIPRDPILSEQAMMRAAGDAAKFSFDYTYQTGVALGRAQGEGYKLLARTYNGVVPYPTYAMHHGSSREQHFSPPGDLNYYDTVHGEINMLIEAQKRGLSFIGTTLFINLLPCPTCARIISQTDIKEIVYELDHSGGYAVRTFQATGKIVRPASPAAGRTL